MRDMENKEAILRYLLWALQQTRHLNELLDLKYDPKNEIVEASFRTYSGIFRKRINVACDSGIAMIKDVVKALE